MLVVAQQAATEAHVALGIWLLPDQQMVTPLIRDQRAVSLAARFSPVSSLLAYSDQNQDLVLYDVDTRTPDRTRFPLKFTKWLSFAWNRGRLIAGGIRTQVWDEHTQTVVWSLPVPAQSAGATIQPPCCALSPDGNCVAASGVERGSIVIYDVESGNMVSRIRETMDAARSIAFDPNGRFLAAVSDNGGVGIWDIATGKPVRPERFRLNADYYWCVRFHPDGQHVVLGLWSGFVDIVRIVDGEYVFSQDNPVHRGRVWDITLTRDGKHMFSGGDDGKILSWNFE